jgi:beta-lactamase superfamily II metal-dependent hydrolase
MWIWTRIGVAALAAMAGLAPSGARAADALDIYFVNVGRAAGANATVLVAPSGESAMLDAGLPMMAPRVLAVLERAGVERIDYLVNTHFHADHFGGTARLAETIPIVNFVDHGETVERGKDDDWWKARRTGARPGMGEQYDRLYETYLKACEKGRRIAVRPGDAIPIRGIEMRVVCAGGKVIDEPRPGAGQPNQSCDGEVRRGDDDAEDAQSIGVLVAHGAFKFLFLGDLTWNVALDLFCPRNKVGTVDAYLITHHGQSYPATMGAYYHGLSAAPKAEVHALRPRVAILSLGTLGHRLGNSGAMETVLSSPGLEDLWQTDLVREGGEKGHNAPERFIANVEEGGTEARYIKLSALADGSFTVTNPRTGFSKRYPPRARP